MKNYSVSVIVTNDIHLADPTFVEGAMFSYPIHTKSGGTNVSQNANRYRIVVQAENKQEAFDKANVYILKAVVRESLTAHPIYAKNGKYAWESDLENSESLPHYRILTNISSRRKDLGDFTPKLEYPMPEGKTPVSKEVRTRHIGSASLLISAMEDKGGTDDEFVSALKYYLVGINAGCDNLDVKAAYEDLGIKELIKKYEPRAKKNKGDNQ